MPTPHRRAAARRSSCGMCGGCGVSDRKKQSIKADEFIEQEIGLPKRIVTVGGITIDLPMGDDAFERAMLLLLRWALETGRRTSKRDSVEIRACYRSG